MFCIRLCACVLFQAAPQTGLGHQATCARSTSTSAVASSSYYTTHFTTSTEPYDSATTITSSSTCNANITIDYPVNEKKKALARHIASGVGCLSKLRCNDCEIDHPSQLQHDCLLPGGILIDMRL